MTGLERKGETTHGEGGEQPAQDTFFYPRRIIQNANFV